MSGWDAAFYIQVGIVTAWTLYAIPNIIRLLIRGRKGRKGRG